MKSISRRNFLKGSAAVIGANLISGCNAFPKEIPGQLLTTTQERGHLLRTKNFPPPAEQYRKLGAVIIGGGVAGLSAGWWMKRSGFDDFALYELNDDVGGNASYGANSISSYPWGAHYVPVPGIEAKYLHKLFEETGVIDGYDKSGKPSYNELFLCSDPQERLYLHGTWQDGIIPKIGLRKSDREQFRNFSALVQQYLNLRGNDEKRAFVIPIRESSRDPKILRLDRDNFADFLDQRGFDSPYLRWYLNYCCLDDYGAGLADVSAWSGLHYFAARQPWAANVDDESNLTWPEGNGWLIQHLRKLLRDNLNCATVVFRIKQDDNGCTVDFFNAQTGSSQTVQAHAVIFAAPLFTYPYLAIDPEFKLPKSLTYSPWMVANISIRTPGFIPDEFPAWDSVIFGGSSLGYVVATHQNVKSPARETVLTYYQPQSDKPPSEARRMASAKSHSQWCHEIIQELRIPHPMIEEMIKSIDVRLWGHGMVRPTPGLIWDDALQSLVSARGNIFFAHSDLSGLSIFEEAQYHGVEAAKSVLRLVKG